MAAKKPAPKKSTVPAVVEPKAAPLAVALTPKHLKAAIAFRDKAATTVISDKASDEGALVTIKEGKELRRKILADWDGVKRPLNNLIEKVRDLEKAELAAVDAGLKPITDRHVAWKELDDARIAAEAEAERIAKEKKAKADREADLQRQEDAAAALEAESDELSAREKKFVEMVAAMRGTSLDGPKTPEYAATQAGFKSPELKGPALLTSPKIAKAIESIIAAKAIREQAEALREQPVVITTTKKESKVATVSGIRHTTNYKCEGIVDLAKFVAAYRAGDLDDDAMEPNLVFLNAEAERLKDKFEQAYPGARLKVTKGVAG